MATGEGRTFAEQVGGLGVRVGFKGLRFKGVGPQGLGSELLNGGVYRLGCKSFGSKDS